MPHCLKFTFVGNSGANTLSYGRTVIFNADGSKPNTNVQVYPHVAILDEGVESIDSCDAVALTGAEYRQIVASLAAPVDEVNEVNVTADIFIGCLLVLCFIGGWIAGGQR